MKTLEEYLATLTNPDHRQKMVDVLDWVKEEFPDLNLEIKWKQPMFIHQGTFIIGFSSSKAHMSVAPEKPVLDEFVERILASGYTHTKMQFRIRYDQDVDTVLLRDMIEHSIEFKKGSTTFWAS